MAATAPCSSHIRDSLLTAETRLLDAVLAGPSAVDTFHESWATLSQEIASKSASLDEETLRLAGSALNTVAIIGQGFLDFATVSSTFRSRLLSEFVAELGQLGQDRQQAPHRSPSHQYHHLPNPSLQPPRHPTTTPIASARATTIPSRNPSSTAPVTASSRSASDPNPLPEFIEHAYKFFVSHIFNPYPTREEKQAIVDETNNSRVTRSTVSNWFANARRRCGWMDILRQRCNRNRDQMVDLAKRVFVKPDPRHPVDPQIVTELIKMKESAEAMYEDNTRTSAWIDELEEMEELINPIPEVERLAAKKRETDAERELRKRQKEMLKEQRDFERRKRKMQAEALRKADRVAKHVPQAKEKTGKNNEQSSTSLVVSYPPTEQDGNESVTEPSPVAGGKRKLDSDDDGSNEFCEPRHVSPAYSLSSSFDSDLSSDGLVPSLSWSDSGDERPYKRCRASASTPYTKSSSVTPALEIPASFDYSFTFEPPTGLTNDPAEFNSIFSLSANTGESHVATPQPPLRGQKRLVDLEEDESTPQAKRAKPIVASSGPELPLAPSTPLFTPPPSINETPTVSAGRRSSFEPVDVDAVWGLDQTSPPPMDKSQQDASLPLDIGVFDWSSCANPALDPLGSSMTGDSPADYAQLFQLFTEDVLPSHLGAPKPIEQDLDTQLELPSFNVPASDFLLQLPAPATTNSDSHVNEELSLDLSGLMSGLMSEEAYNDLGLTFPESTASTSPDLSRSSSSVSLAWTSAPETIPTPAEQAEKLQSKARKRKELEEKKAALERERARLAELERELEDE